MHFAGFDPHTRAVYGGAVFENKRTLVHGQVSAGEDEHAAVGCKIVRCVKGALNGDVFKGERAAGYGEHIALKWRVGGIRRNGKAAIPAHILLFAEAPGFVL